MFHYFFRLTLISLFMVTVTPASIVYAKTDMAKAFGSVGGVLNISLSPDGNHVAFIAPSTGLKTDLYWIDLNGDPRPKKCSQHQANQKDC